MTGSNGSPPEDGKGRPASRSRPSSSPNAAWSVAVIGMEMGISVLVMTLGGAWLDDRYDTSPWFTLAGAGLGIVGGFYALFSQVRRVSNTKSRRGEK